MSNIKKMKDEALGTVDAALAILNKFPSLSDTNASLSFNTSTNPFEFLLDLFKTTAGYNKVLDILSYFITFELPAVEIAVKGVLLANIKNLLSCSINPFIPLDLLRDGFVFNVDQIDITDTLKYSPLKGYQPPSDNPFKYGEGWNVHSLDAVNYLENIAARKNRNVGSYYYFGCDDCTCPDDIPNLPYDPNIFVEWKSLTGKSKPLDFNALLWYTINRANQRQVWGVSEKLTRETENDKHKKSNGILTLDYHARPSGLQTADGSRLTNLPPFNQCVQVFIGNAQELQYASGSEIATAHQKKSRINALQFEIVGIRNRLDSLYARLSVRQAELDKVPHEGWFSEDDTEYAEWWTNSLILEILDTMVRQKPSKELSKEIKNSSLDDAIDLLESAKNDTAALLGNLERVAAEFDFENVPPHRKKHDNRTFKYLEKCLSRCYNDINDIYVNLHRDFPDLKQNYYYNRTLIEFNTDYIKSLKLFDSKVIAAQLLDQLTGILHVDLSFSYKELFIREEIKKMVSMIVNSDDAVVSDCFFTFDNSEYSEMMHRAEMQRAGMNTPGVVIKKDDVQSILASLSEMSDTADPAGQVSVIESALKNSLFQGEITTANNLDTDELTGNVNFDIIGRLMDGLAYVIASAVLSPKVYLLILINLHTLGNNTTFDINTFLSHYKQMIVQILREVRDILVSYLVQKLGEILAEIAKEVAVTIGLEQAEYYRRLIRKIIECLKRKKKDIDWTMDKIEHADIDGSEEESARNEQC